MAQAPSWREMLRLAALEDEASQRKAAALFEQLGPQLAESEADALSKELLPLLQQQLRSPRPRERKNAASLYATLATVREDGAALLAPATPLLSSRLSDEEESVRLSCAIALASQKPQPGPAAIQALEALASAQIKLGAKDPVLLVAAVSGIAECADCPQAEPVILRALSAVADPESLRRLVLAIGEGRSRHPGVMKRLAEIAEQQEGKLRLAAVLALGNYGPAAKAHVPVLRALLAKAEEDAELEQAIGSALTRILSPEQ
jgi:hypothetical protein